MLQLFLITSENALYRSLELFPNFFDVKICFQPSVSIPDGPEPPWVLTAAFCIFSTSIRSNLIGWIVSGVSVTNISWDVSFYSGCFNCSWFNVCPVKGKMLFFIGALTIATRVLQIRSVLLSENFLGIGSFLEVRMMLGAHTVLWQTWIFWKKKKIPKIGKIAAKPKVIWMCMKI